MAERYDRKCILKPAAHYSNAARDAGDVAATFSEKAESVQLFCGKSRRHRRCRAPNGCSVRPSLTTEKSKNYSPNYKNDETSERPDGSH